MTWTSISHLIIATLYSLQNHPTNTCLQQQTHLTIVIPDHLHIKICHTLQQASTDRVHCWSSSQIFNCLCHKGYIYFLTKNIYIIGNSINSEFTKYNIFLHLFNCLGPFLESWLLRILKLLSFYAKIFQIKAFLN